MLYLECFEMARKGDDRTLVLIESCSSSTIDGEELISYWRAIFPFLAYTSPYLIFQYYSIAGKISEPANVPFINDVYHRM